MDFFFISFCLLSAQIDKVKGDNDQLRERLAKYEPGVLEENK
jgi:hypothetical protein